MILKADYWIVCKLKWENTNEITYGQLKTERILKYIAVLE